MRCLRVVVASAWILALLIVPVRAAFADTPEFADRPGLTVSGTMGMAFRSDGPAIHFWLGAGLRLPAQEFRAMLLGAELDVTFPDDDPTLTEIWLVSRAILGGYGEGAGFVPEYSVYAFAGAPLRMGEYGASVRVGVGASAIALMQLAEIGFPNMIELGLDGGDDMLHGFLRLGWHL